MRQNLGQHFLKNEAVINEMVDAVDPEPGDIVIEIGTGHGELTLPLAERCSEQQCSVVTIEKDPSLAREFMRASEGLAPENITLIEGDARELVPELLGGSHSDDWKEEESRDSSVASLLQNDEKAIKIVGNLPYYLTNYLLRQLADTDNKPERCVFTVQKEVAERMSAEPPHMNKLAAAVQWWAQPFVLGFIRKEDFDPPPEVDGAVVLLLAKELASPEQAGRYWQAHSALFRHPRKTILNNLSTTDKSWNRADTQTALEQIGIDPSARPETLSVEDIERIADQLFENSNQQT